jgi:hypothetical protein
MTDPAGLSNATMRLRKGRISPPFGKKRREGFDAVGRVIIS